MSVTLIRAVIIYLFVITSVRIMGKRQIGELQPHELVVTVLVSQAASLPLEHNGMPLANMIIPILIFVSFEIIVSAISMKSLSFRNLLQGKPIFVIKNGKIDEKQLKRLRFTVDDLIDGIRQKDVFDISTVQDAIIETNGTISVLQKAEESPVTPKQLSLKVDKVSTPIAIVIDGKPITEYFGEEKMNMRDIEVTVKKATNDITKILLLTADENGNTYIAHKKEQSK